ncbi:MAG: purine-nucleoside phosphorylase [Thermoanaerobaculia bacterium]
MTASKLDLGGARIAVVLGSGLGGFAERLEDRAVVPYSKLRGFPRSGVVGHRGELVLGACNGVRVAVLSGRSHYYEGHAMARVVSAVRQLARAGAKAVILTNAAGGIRRSFRPGDFMLLKDHLNGFGTNPLVGPNDESLGPRFPDMSAVYDPVFRTLARSAARRLRIPLREGVYVGLHGPSYETPAEIRMWRTLGADAVGMSTVPEAIALRHAGVRVLAISTITNMAAGVVRRPIVHSDVLKQGRRVSDRLGRLLAAIVRGVDVRLRMSESE